MKHSPPGKEADRMQEMIVGALAAAAVAAGMGAVKKKITGALLHGTRPGRAARCR